MEVTGKSFEANLQGMLRSLAGSSFVAIDLELSGVPHMRSGRELDSLQERYVDIKEAADTFSVVQLGLTIVHKAQDGGYKAHTYNMCLNPIISESLDLTRNLTFSNRTASFLLRNGFDMQRLYQDGVPYLSRREIAKAEAKERERVNGKPVSDVMLRPEDVDLHAFVAKIRREINQWCKEPNGEEELLFSHQPYLLTRLPSSGLSRLEKRLVHQVVRTEFPELVAVPCGGGLHIKKFNKAREEAVQRQRESVFRECIQKQSGVLWFVEALCGGNLDQLDVVSQISRSSSQTVLVDVHEALTAFSKLNTDIENTRIVLIGHNLLVDLVFFYRTFIGHLPHHIDEFCTVIHELFPLIIDTKYMATQANFRRSHSSLEDVDAEYSKQILPKIEFADTRFSKYESQSYAHEAGYDSFLTARVLIRMSAYLSATQIGSQKAPQPQRETVFANKTSSARPDIPKDDPFRWLLLPSPGPAPAPIALSSSPSSSSLTLIEIDPMEVDPPASEVQVHSVQDSTKDNDMRAANAEATEAKIEQYMPEWDDSFWQKYGNKLRVYGTCEGELKLGPFKANM